MALYHDMSHFKDANQGLTTHHKDELRKRLAQMAQQKDELHEGDKALALKENDRHWEGVLTQKLEELRNQLLEEQALEVEAIQRACDKTIQDLTSQVFHTIQKNSNTTCIHFVPLN